jgi:hypothetical protein
MKILVFKDAKSGGYTAWHESFPQVITQVDNLSEVKENLSNIFYDIIHGSEIEEQKLD